MTKIHLPDVGGIMTLEDISEMISEIETDAKGVPVLIKQYLKLGGRMLGFNIDQQFSDVVDGLIRVDLRQTEPRILAKYMGLNESEAFLAYHANDQLKSV